MNRIFCKSLILLGICLSVMITPALAAPDGHAFGFCEQGNQQVVVGGLTSTTRVQRSYPSCTVSVYIGSSGTLATIYSNATGSVLTNPFTATTTGSWQFYADNGYFTVVLSGGGLPAPVTLGLFTVISTGIGGWTYTAATNFPTTVGSIVPTSVIAATDNPQLIVGAASANSTSKLTVVGSGTAGGISVMAASSTTSILSSYIVAGSSVQVDSTSTGGGTVLPIDLAMAEVSAVRFQTSRNVSIGTLVDNGFKLDVQGTFNATGVSTFGGGLLSINATGNLTKVNNIAYSWPASQGAASTVLTNDGAGNLTWGVGGGGGGITCAGCTTNVLMKFNGTNGANSTFFDDGTSASIGTLAATDDPTTIRFQVQKNQNQSSNLLMRNSTAGTLSRAFITARSDGASNDISMGVTSSTYTTAGGVSNLAGLIYTGTGTTSGMTIQTGATNSHIYFQPGGTTVIGDLATTGLTITGTISNSGNLSVGTTTTLNGITYTWPASQAAGTYLSTNGSGTLSWSAVGGAAGISGSGTLGNVVVFTAGTAVGNSVMAERVSGGVATTVRNTSVAPNIQWYASGQAADEKLWALGANGNAMFFATRTDADAAGTTIFTATRSTGTGIASLLFGVPLMYTIGQNASTDLITTNSNAGTAARSAFVASSNAGSIYMGVTSNAYTFIGSAQASQAFVATVDATVTNGIVFKSVAGPFLFRPAHGVVAAATNALMTMTADYAVELTDTSTAATGATGTVRMRNNAGVFELSQNGQPYASVSTGGVTGTGTLNLGAKWTGAGSIGNSTYYDDGSTATIGSLGPSDNGNIRFEVRKDINSDVIGLIRNDTSDTLATVKWGARSGNASNDIAMGVTSAAYGGGSGIPASSGIINTGVNTSNGLYIQTGAGAIRLQTGGTNTRMVIDGTSGYVAVGNVTPGEVFHVELNQPASTNLLVRNTTSGATARTAIVARSGTGSDDITMLVTSPGYTPIGGVSANAGLIYTGTGATAGMTFQTGATNSHIYLQPGSTAVVGDWATTGLTITGTLNTSGVITGNGSGLTTLNATNLTTGVVAIARGGTGNVAYTGNRLPFYNGSVFADSRMSDNGTDLNVVTGSINVNTSGQGIRFASTGSGVGAGIDGNAGGINITIAGQPYGAFDNTNSATATNLYVRYNGARTQVLAGTCTVAGGTHTCLYIP